MIYAVEKDDLYLVGTSEVPLAGMHIDEILTPGRCRSGTPGFSTCFRREAGADGKDTRGIFRVHQFDKVEMFSFDHRTGPGTSTSGCRDPGGDPHGLGLPCRVVDIAVGDLGARRRGSTTSRCGSRAAGLPRADRASNCTDYQARRLGAASGRRRDSPGVHTLNGTAVAVGRTLIALLENGQRADGTVGVPEALVDAGAPAVIGAG